MNTEVMKNMIVIKNLPSNMLEQAFIILKPNLKVKELNTVKSKTKENCYINQKEDNYVVKEAELLVSEYISKIEKGDNIRKNSVIEKKYRNMKRFSIISFCLAILGLAINIIL